MAESSGNRSSRETLRNPDGASIWLVHVTPESARGVAVLLPALGVAAGYYERAAQYLATRGIAASVLEARGQGESEVKPARGADFGYQELLDDLNVTLRALRRRYPGLPVVLLGHSLGGHLCMMQLAIHPESVDAVALITTAAPHHGAYQGSARRRVWLGTRMARVVSVILGYYPGDRLGFGGVQPRKLIREWSTMGRTGDYFMEDCPVDIEAELQHVRTPVLSIPIEGDELAPRAACETVTAKIPNAQLDWAPVGSPPLSPKGAHHQRWAREPAPIMDAVVEFLERSQLIGQTSNGQPTRDSENPPSPGH